MPSSSYRPLSLTLSITTAVSALPAAAQTPPDGNGAEIVVTADRVRGAVESDIPPVQQLNSEDISAYGASSIADLLTALSPQTNSGRGRGGGQPIILLNGQRISGFRELRDIPPEAIRQVQIFPEEVALQYGFRPDQRVINFILKDNFSTYSAEIEAGLPEAGGFSTQQIQSSFTVIGKSTRINLNAQYQHSDRLTQADRGILNDSDDEQFEFDGNINEFRTLRPETNIFDLGGSVNKILGRQTSLSLTAGYQLQDSTALLGLPSASLLLPGSSVFSRSGQDAVIGRIFNDPGPLTRSSVIDTASFGSAFNGLIGGWRWTVTADYNWTKSDILTVRNADFTSLRARLIDGTANPFAADFGRGLSFLPADTADSSNRNLTLVNIFSGELFRLPAGPVQVTLRTGFNRQTLSSASVILGQTASASLGRSEGSAALTLDIPLVKSGVGPLGVIGDVSINGNYGRSALSDFGGLTEYTAGIRWTPIKPLSLQISWIGDEAAPGIALLGNPAQTTPNVPFFDFVRGASSLIDLVSGGNPALLAERRRDVKASLAWQPKKIGTLKTEGLNIQIEYFRNRSNNTSNPFPLLTPEIEAAFAGRVIRGDEGQLISVDQRPVNYAEERTENIRWGFNFSGGIGAQQQPAARRGPDGSDTRSNGGGQRRGGSDGAGGARPADGGRSSSAGPGAPARGDRGGASGSEAGGSGAGGSGASGAGGRGAGGSGEARGGAGRGAPFAFGGGPGGRPPSRWQISLYHNYQIRDQILIAQGIPLLDRLNGSATSALGGTPQHRIELSGGLFHKGLGLRAEGNYRSATRVGGSEAAGSGDLRFGALTAINLRFFVNLDERGKLTQKAKFLRGGRIAFSIDNLFDDIIDVRDENGAVPLSLQRGFIDPVGRFFELSFRKRF